MQTSQSMQRRAFLRGAAGTLAPATALLLAYAAALRSRQPHVIRLSSNENPLGMPESAQRAISGAVARLGHRYPPMNAAVTVAIADRHGVAAENIVLGNGSSEILQMAVQAMCVGQGKVRVVVSNPTFEQVEQYAVAMGADIATVQLLPDYSHDLTRMQAIASASRDPTLIYICNPNNPTGTLTRCDDIGDLIRRLSSRTWVLIDEAYFEFVNAPSHRTFIPEAISIPNVIVSRTFSKIYGLAGVRLGYGVANAVTVQALERLSATTNVNQFALEAGIACLNDGDSFVRLSIDLNRAGSEFVCHTLEELELEYLPSQANFIMHRIDGHVNDYVRQMREAGIIVGRPFRPLLTYNRVSIGLPREMEVWADALRKIRAGRAP